MNCADCGMPVKPREYHPFAACLMFKACRSSRVVRANLKAEECRELLAVEDGGADG